MHSTNPLRNHDEVWFVVWREGGKLHTRAHSTYDYAIRSTNNLTSLYGIDLARIVVFKGVRAQFIPGGLSI